MTGIVVDRHVRGGRAPGSPEEMLDILDHWADRGWLRRLDAALARFVAELVPATAAPTLLAVALTAHLEGQGHTCLVVAELLDDDGPDLSWSSDAIDALRFVLRRMPLDEASWIAMLGTCDAVESVSAERLDASDNAPFVLDGGRFYLRRYWRHERRIADAILARTVAHVDVDEARLRRSIEQLFDRRDASDPDWQRIACAIALRGRIAIVTGGPGTGKTYTAARLIALHFATVDDPATLEIALAAPTGKAAARLRQSINAALDDIEPRMAPTLALRRLVERIAPARTLHALLGTRRGTRRFRHDAQNPLEVDVLVVDEASMIHVEMMDALLTALPATARLILVGDRDQLASVEAGAVLGELCGGPDDRYDDDTVRYVAATTGNTIHATVATGSAPLAQRIVRLRRGERFTGALDRLAGAVHSGRADDAISVLRDAGSDVIGWRRDASPATAVDVACEGYRPFVAALARPPHTLFAEDYDAWVVSVLAAFELFRVLSPVREGPWGVDALNRSIEQRLFVAAGPLPRNGWYPGRPVLVTRNDAALGVFNGDAGVVLPASAGDARLRVWFSADTTVRSVSASRLTAVETAFATTVHRAQGSEFDGVALLVPSDAPRAVTRELLYTGITRARRTLTIVSDDDGTALTTGIVRGTRRSSGLATMLAQPD